VCTPVAVVLSALQQPLAAAFITWGAVGGLASGSGTASVTVSLAGLDKRPWVACVTVVNSSV
jgi:hypothetical protein